MMKMPPNVDPELLLSSQPLLRDEELPTQEQLLVVHSPASLAVISNKAWQLPKHLNFLDEILRNAVLDAEAGLLDGLTISCPPQHGKSQLCSRYLPAWYLGTRPGKRVILASYEAEFAASWSRQARDVLARHGSLFGVDIAKGAATASNWEIAYYGGGMSSAGAGGPITGKGASLFIVDDPVKNDAQARSPLFRQHQWEWWESVATTRLSPRGLFVVIQTRWHRDDLTGRIEEWVQHAGLAPRWRFVRLPAIAEEDDPFGRAPGEALWPERYSAEHLARLSSGKSPYYWRALYQQDPQAEGGTEWPAEWFSSKELWFDEWPTAWKAKVIALDPSKGKDAKHGDYSAFVMLLVDAENRIWVDADLRRVHVVEVVETAIELQRQFQADLFGIETNQFQELLADQIWNTSRDRKLTVPAVGVLNTSQASKRVRICRLGPYLSRGAIRFKANSPGARLLFEQTRDFPTAEHDDGPDALEMAIRIAEQLIAGRHSRDDYDFDRVVAW